MIVAGSDIGRSKIELRARCSVPAFAKATLSGLETIRTIKRGHIYHQQPGVRDEIEFIASLFETAA
jgi:hypothetical protein